MDYKKECPYCHKNVKMKVLSYAPDYNMYGHIFWCDCVKYDEDNIRFNDHAAYQTYLEKRELNNYTNFDKYFNHSNYTIDEVEAYIDNWCGIQLDLDCKDCPFGKVGQLLTDKKYFGGCDTLTD